MDNTHPIQQLVLYFDVLIQFFSLHVSLFISYIRIMITSCICSLYLHGSDCIDIC